MILTLEISKVTIVPKSKQSIASMYRKLHPCNKVKVVFAFHTQFNQLYWVSIGTGLIVRRHSHFEEVCSSNLRTHVGTVPSYCSVI